MKSLSEIVLEPDCGEVAQELETSFSTDEGISDAIKIDTREAKFAGGIQGVLIGVLIGFSESGFPLVDFSENQSGEPVVARSIVALRRYQIGSEMLLGFDRGSVGSPVILGTLLNRVCDEQGEDPEIQQSEDRIVLSACKEIILNCGEASVVLTQSGKIVIRGTYVVSESSGVNRIRGGSVQIN